MKFYDNPKDAYLAHQSTIRHLLGIYDVEYSSLNVSQQFTVNNKLLSLTKLMYDTYNKPSFLLFDFGILHDTNILLQRNSNPQLLIVTEHYINHQVNFYAGYSASLVTPYNSFLRWAENDAIDVGCPINKVICTSYYGSCDDVSLRQELNTSLILQSALNAKNILQYGMGINNGLRLVALYDCGSLQESSLLMLENASAEIVRDIAGHVEFLLQLSSTDLCEILSSANDMRRLEEESTNQWEEEQYIRITNLMKQARREAIRQRGLIGEQARLEAEHRDEQSRHAELVSNIERANSLIIEQNAAATASNAAAEQSARFTHASSYLQKLSNRHGAASEMYGQASIGGGSVQHSLCVSIVTSRHNGLTVVSNHTIHQGSRVIASANSIHNSVAAYNQRAANVVATAQARQHGRELPLRIRGPLDELRNFVAQNSENLQGFDLPSFENPYLQNRASFFHGYVPGVTSSGNFGQQVVENGYSFDRADLLNNLHFNSDSKFNAEVEGSSWNRVAQQFKRNSEQTGEIFSYIPEPAQPERQSLFMTGLGGVVHAAARVISLGSTSHANPVLLSSAATSAYAAPMISGVSHNKNIKYKKFGDELQEVGKAIKKVILLSSLLANPNSAQHVLDILTTPVHEMGHEDTILPGGNSETNVDANLPPYQGHAIDADGHMLPGNSSGPDVSNEMVNVPPRTDGFLFLFREKMASGEVKFKRWARGDAIDKPLPDGTAPTWDSIRSRYWRNRYVESRNTGEFNDFNLERMKDGLAPQDYNPRTNQWESRELHHVIPQQHQGSNAPQNLRELTPDQHAEVDPYRLRIGVSTKRGIL